MLFAYNVLVILSNWIACRGIVRPTKHRVFNIYVDTFVILCLPQLFQVYIRNSLGAVFRGSTKYSCMRLKGKLNEGRGRIQQRVSESVSCGNRLKSLGGILKYPVFAQIESSRILMFFLSIFPQGRECQRILSRFGLQKFCN